MTKLANVLLKHISLLKDCGIETAEKDASLLISFALGFTSNHYFLAYDRQIGNLELSKINHLIDRRAHHEPIAKIIGKKLFWNSSFYVNKNVLDPRPETEVLVQAVLSNVGEAKSILDLGTGTGCVAISLALILDQVTIYASDVSLIALSVARRNAREKGAEVQFILSNWFSNFSRKFDIIISNPPYISDSDFLKLPIDVREYDPKVSLVGGVDGLDCYRKIAKSLLLYLCDGGLAFFEIGFGQKEEAILIFSQEGLSLVNVWSDLNGVERVICVKKDA